MIVRNKDSQPRTREQTLHRRNQLVVTAPLALLALAGCTSESSPPDPADRIVETSTPGFTDGHEAREQLQQGVEHVVAAVPEVVLPALNGEGIDRRRAIKDSIVASIAPAFVLVIQPGDTRGSAQIDISRTDYDMRLSRLADQTVSARFGSKTGDDLSQLTAKGLKDAYLDNSLVLETIETIRHEALACDLTQEDKSGCVNTLQTKITFDPEDGSLRTVTQAEGSAEQDPALVFAVNAPDRVIPDDALWQLGIAADHINELGRQIKGYSNSNRQFA